MGDRPNSALVHWVPVAVEFQVVLLDHMRKEVLRLEGKMERLQKELAVTTASLDTCKKQLKVSGGGGFTYVR